MGRLPRPAADRLHQLAAARPVAALHGVEPGGGAGLAPALRFSSQPAAHGIRQRRGRARRDAGTDDRGGSGGLFRRLSRLPVLSRFHRSRRGIRAATSAEGPSHYFGYLLDLQRHHAGRPVLVAEYGVPSSRGVSHLQPEGMHHGGHDEEEMAAIDVRLTREIREAGLAGGLVFAWLDEWFKHTWVTIDLELPAERTRLWHNVMDAEQNYGLLGECAGAGDATL